MTKVLIHTLVFLSLRWGRNDDGDADEGDSTSAIYEACDRPSGACNISQQRWQLKHLAGRRKDLGGPSEDAIDTHAIAPVAAEPSPPDTDRPREKQVHDPHGQAPPLR